ncbi:phosphoglucosamine mutase [Thiomicrospira microaerophila]|uniref:phosphoglucosamine mutase n=1 Tax=Thiomicrospira microaerophila TaxID=406020 RepID=UPI00200FDF06|nr:phosphoglucosamine mutase [Thiomicrospira microaerophila]UQB42860.1 phosphoglucosamine mutase [Thiomicrospira microaerophila]
MSQKKYFGTDGIRNRVGKGLMSPDMMLKLGWAVGRVLKAQGGSKVMIGKDTRISGYMFESALEAGLIYAGVDVMLLGPMPTPAVAYLTQTFHADLGIVISASHNPHYDNGVKFFDGHGAKISDEMELAIEVAFEDEMRIEGGLDQLATLGRATRINDAPGRYIEFCKSTYRGQDKLDGIHVVVDCAHGATYHVAPLVFKELGARVTVIGDHPDGLNINQGCGATELAALQSKVVELGADVGFALDGDGDRLMVVDSTGQVLDGDDLLLLLATSSSYQNQQGVVGTLMTNKAVENKLIEKGFEFIRANVGDRYVMQELKQRGWLLGAEASGHILCLDRSTTGDGIVAALQVLEVMVKNKINLNEFRAQTDKFTMKLINVAINKPFDINASPALLLIIRELETKYNQDIRILIRPSGTEPLVRVMVESSCDEIASKSAELLAESVEKSFS